MSMGGTKQKVLHLICAVAGSCVKGTLNSTARRQACLSGRQETGSLTVGDCTFQVKWDSGKCKANRTVSKTKTPVEGTWER